MSLLKPILYAENLKCDRRNTFCKLIFIIIYCLSFICFCYLQQNPKQTEFMSEWGNPLPATQLPKQNVKVYFLCLKMDYQLTHLSNNLNIGCPQLGWHTERCWKNNRIIFMHKIEIDELVWQSLKAEIHKLQGIFTFCVQCSPSSLSSSSVVDKPIFALMSI